MLLQEMVDVRIAKVETSDCYALLLARQREAIIQSREIWSRRLADQCNAVRNLDGERQYWLDHGDAAVSWLDKAAKAIAMVDDPENAAILYTLGVKAITIMAVLNSAQVDGENQETTNGKK